MEYVPQEHRRPEPGQGDGYERPILPPGVRRGTVQEFIGGLQPSKRGGLRVVRG